MDEIRIKGLTFFARHGVLQTENENGQIFLVDATLYTDFRAAALNDELDKTVDYSKVSDFISAFMEENTFKLIETVASRLADEILLNFAGLKRVDIEVFKPHAPIKQSFENISVFVSRSWHRVYASFGSNMGDRGAHIENGLNMLKQNKKIKNVKISGLYETAPYGFIEQDPFLNGAVAFDTIMDKEELLEEFHRIEAEEKRERKIVWGPRTLDLDIVFYDREVYQSETLTIPHIDMQNRLFVLEPLCDLAPGFIHPVLGKSVRQLKEQLDAVQEK
ncbi:MAG: 2-amino-4-hydroxy-6-hydroxymethyldihydropteridine diphosphokinase [Lachnospiraceae bacterium]|nr:2-amino-4-hydroxy-6-hydroxymethyldihydropteridine diphosphokinase [Lachnospiraceae bacterium]